MGTNPKAEFLAQIARRNERIEKSIKRIEQSNAFIKQSNRLIRIAVGHDIDGEGSNHVSRSNR
jgi:hypothetical protein